MTEQPTTEQCAELLPESQDTDVETWQVESATRVRRGGAPSKRHIEDVPSLDYLERLEQAGPREGETKLGFVKHMAALRAGREAVLAAWHKHHGNAAMVAAELGMSHKSLHTDLRRLGLSIAVLRRSAPPAAAMSTVQPVIAAGSCKRNRAPRKTARRSRARIDVERDWTADWEAWRAQACIGA